MKRGRKPAVSLDDLTTVLKSYKNQIIIDNVLMKPSNSLWQTIIEENNWNMNKKSLWTRIHKFSPNFENFFNQKKKSIYNYCLRF